MVSEYYYLCEFPWPNECIDLLASASAKGKLVLYQPVLGYHCAIRKLYWCSVVLGFDEYFSSLSGKISVWSKRFQNVGSSHLNIRSNLLCCICEITENDGIYA